MSNLLTVSGAARAHPRPARAGAVGGLARTGVRCPRATPVGGRRPRPPGALAASWCGVPLLTRRVIERPARARRAAPLAAAAHPRNGPLERCAAPISPITAPHVDHEGGRWPLARARAAPARPVGRVLPASGAPAPAPPPRGRHARAGGRPDAPPQEFKNSGNRPNKLSCSRRYLQLQ